MSEFILESEAYEYADKLTRLFDDLLIDKAGLIAQAENPSSLEVLIKREHVAAAFYQILGEVGKMVNYNNEGCT